MQNISPKQEMTSCTHAVLAASYVHNKKLNSQNKAMLYLQNPMFYWENGNNLVLSITGIEKNIDVK